MYNNVLIFSDIHINDYSSYNQYKESRLLQTRVLTDLLISAGSIYNCDRFIIAGDVTEVPIMKPNVLNEIRYMFNKLCSYYALDNYIIYGQHDLSTKELEQDPRFSGLTAILPSNLYYADKCQFELCGRNIAMMNWRPIQDLSWINGCVDLFVGHVTLAPPNAQYKGQHIDESKFNLSITGDIHKHFSTGKMVSIGSCQQNKLGDQIESTAIVWNPNDNSWFCINLDPDRKLLQMKYTGDRKMEGFNKEENCYYIYKPIKFISSDSNIINIPKWDEISSLVDDVIKSNGLQAIHNEVLNIVKNSDESIDFNFIPIKLRLENFRSIEHAEVYFDDMDKISILGDNGSGKSSFILGLYNALKDNRSLKDFIRFGADSCECEIEFIYHGVNNKILRGTKSYGCWINGEKLPYNNKREFEDDMYCRFPFLSYTDVFFFNSDKSSILGSMAPERKSEVISKLFKIDKIDTYNSVAKDILNKVYESINNKIDEMNRLTASISSLSAQLSTIKLPKESLDELIIDRDEMMKCQSDYQRYINSKSELDKLNGKLEYETDRLNKINSRLSAIDYSKIESRLREIDFRRLEISNSINLKDKLLNERSQVMDKLSLINENGSKMYSDLQKVKSNICPTCGSRIQMKDLEDSLNKSISNLLSERSNLLSKLSSIESELPKIDETKMKDEDNKLSSEYKSIQESLSDRKSLETQLIEANKSLTEINKIIESSSKDLPKEVKLPENFYERLNSVISKIGSWESYNSISSSIESYNLQLDKVNKDLDESKSSVQLIDRYVKLTSSTGDIYREVMSKISSDFSDDVIRYDVNQYKFRGKDHLDLDVQYNVAGRWVSYQSLSSGQKTMADVNFLSRILVECGLLVFDETLKHLSQSSTEYCLDIMKGMNIHTMILTSHMYGVESFANKCIDLNLDENGLTKINVR